MSGPWNARQVEWLQALGIEVLYRVPDASCPRPAASPTAVAVEAEIPPGLQRAARGVDLSPLLARFGAPRDAGTRRAFWRMLRPLRKAASGR